VHVPDDTNQLSALKTAEIFHGMFRRTPSIEEAQSGFDSGVALRKDSTGETLTRDMAYAHHTERPSAYAHRMNERPNPNGSLRPQGAQL
jgi:hypothetical protein